MEMGTCTRMKNEYRWCFKPEDAELVAMWIGPHREQKQSIQKEKLKLQFNVEQTGNNQARLPPFMAATGLVHTVYQLTQASSGRAEEAEQKKTNAKGEEETTKQTDNVFHECLLVGLAANPAADPAAATVGKEAAHLKDTAAPLAADVEATEEAIPAHSGVPSVPAASASASAIASGAPSTVDTALPGNSNEWNTVPPSDWSHWHWHRGDSTVWSTVPPGTHGAEQGIDKLGLPKWIERGAGKANGYKIWIGDLPPELNQTDFINDWLKVDPVVEDALNAKTLIDVHIYCPENNVSKERVAYLTFKTLEPAMACMRVISKWGRYSDGGWGKVWVKMSVKWVNG